VNFWTVLNPVIFWVLPNRLFVDFGSRSSLPQIKEEIMLNSSSRRRIDRRRSSLPLSRRNSGEGTRLNALGAAARAMEEVDAKETAATAAAAAAADSTTEEPAEAPDPNLDDDEADGGDSDVEGDEIHHHTAMLVERFIFDAEELLEEEVDLDADAFKEEDGELVKGDRVKYDRHTTDLKIHKVPEGYIIQPYEVAGTPAWEDVDNPGGWDHKTFQPKYTGTAPHLQYKHHALATGVTPVPADRNGKREHNGFEFIYDGSYRVDKDIPFRPGHDVPDARKATLDPELLKAHGLTPETHDQPIKYWDFIFPIVDPGKSGVPNDGRMPYYVPVTKWTGNYQYQKDIANNPYGHYVSPVTHQESIRFDGIIIANGALGGAEGDIHCRYVAGTPQYSQEIVNSMPFERFKKVKRSRKLCDNTTAAQRGEEGYDPAYKYDYIYQCLSHNTNYFTKLGNLDLCVDETSWPFGGFGEPKAGVVYNFKMKPFPRGGQVVLASSVGRTRIHSYVHRHDCHKKPAGYTTGSNEVRMLVDSIQPMVRRIDDDSEAELQGEYIYKPKSIFFGNPSFTADNFFPGEALMDKIGKLGWSYSGTWARNKLPGNSKYFHKEKIKPNKTNKICRWYQPIVAWKYVKPVSEEEAELSDGLVPGKGYWRQHMSMMSTGATNIGGVNCFDEMFAYAMMRKRGRGEKTFLWPIEMNQAREHYLTTYNAVDRIDHRLRNLHLKLRSWKYWHSPMVHAMGLGVVTCYDMYLEVCEGKLDGFPRVKNPMSLKDFQSKLGLALLSYHPKNKKVMGDEKLRQYTQVAKAQRPAQPRKRTHEDIVSQEAYLFEKGRQPNAKRARFCEDANCLIYHLNNQVTLANPKNCGVCNKPTYTACGLCNGSDRKPIPLHFPNNRSKSSDGNCVVIYHDKYYFGLCAADLPVRGWAKKDWKAPTQAVYNANKRAIQQYENPTEDNAAAADDEEEEEEEEEEVGDMEAV